MVKQLMKMKNLTKNVAGMMSTLHSIPKTKMSIFFYRDLMRH
jgi:hypothetical protein